MEVVIGGRSGEWYQSVGAPRKLVSTVTIQALTGPHEAPHDESAEVHPSAKDQAPDGPWDECAKHVVDGVGVLCGDANCGHIRVVLLVDIGINGLQV